MTILPDHFLHALRLLSFVALLALSACGPGTGGTGTGPINGLSYGGTVGTTFGPGMSVGLPCAENCLSVNLRLDEEKVEFIAPCYRFVHLGPWPIETSGVAELQGTLEITSFMNNQPKVDTIAAIMRLQFSEAKADSREVTLTVRGVDGRNLLNALTLQRGDGSQSASSCKMMP
jgi:hypothetical protein